MHTEACKLRAATLPSRTSLDLWLAPLAIPRTRRTCKDKSCSRPIVRHAKARTHQVLQGQGAGSFGRYLWQIRPQSQGHAKGGDYGRQCGEALRQASFGLYVCPRLMNSSNLAALVRPTPLSAEAYARAASLSNSLPKHRSIFELAPDVQWCRVGKKVP